jgi:hypothetical protein
MPAKVKLKDIIEAFELESEEIFGYVNLDTREVHTVERSMLRDAEDLPDDEEPDLLDWQQNAWKIAKEVAYNDRFKRLPSKFDIHEWSIMEDFANSVSSSKISDELNDAIHGRGAFRMFKSIVHRRHIEKDWHAFRDHALREIAIEFCEEHDLAWE